jgi:hypothetical protein
MRTSVDGIASPYIACLSGAMTKTKETPRAASQSRARTTAARQLATASAVIGSTLA